MAEAAAGVMPVGSPMTLPIRQDQVQTTEGGAEPAKFTDDAVAVQVWRNFQTASNWLDNNGWLLDWQETDILYQSPVWNRFVKNEGGRPARVPRFLVAKMTRTIARAIKRALFAEQYPFFLRPKGKTTTVQVDAWMALLGVLLKRAKFQYHCSLLVDCMVLQGTGIGKAGIEERTITRRKRVPKKKQTFAEMPGGQKQEVATVEGDDWEIKPEECTESWPFFEYRRLGTTMFDPKWCTPDLPDESAGYCIDVDYLFFEDLQQMRELDCYKNIPSDETIKTWMFNRQQQSAPVGSQIEVSMTSQGSAVAHAEGRERQTDVDPLKQPLMLIEQWSKRDVKAILHYDGRNLVIRNEEQDYESSLHFTATMWSIDNAGYGMGVGKLVGPDQRINQGVLNACLQLIAYPLNAPILVARGENAPTQNTIARLGGYQQVDVPPGGDVRKSMAFMEMPSIPSDAWKFIQYTQQESEDLVGADSAFQQGNLPGPRSSAARTATGANRIAAMSDANITDPVTSVAQGVIVPFVDFLVRYVKLEMPLQEIRDILKPDHAAIIQSAIETDQLINAEFEIDVLAGQKLAARSAIQQLIPFFLQIVQQPQLLQFLHERGETVDFKVIMDLMLQVSELAQQPDIFRQLTPRERVMLKQMNAGAQKMQQTVIQEKLKGANKVQEIQTKGEVDRANKAAEIVMEHAANGIPLERAEEFRERANDKAVLQNGLPTTAG